MKGKENQYLVSYWLERREKRSYRVLQFCWKPYFCFFYYSLNVLSTYPLNSFINLPIFNCYFCCFFDYYSTALLSVFKFSCCLVNGVAFSASLLSYSFPSRRISFIFELCSKALAFYRIIISISVMRTLIVVILSLNSEYFS